MVGGRNWKMDIALVLAVVGGWKIVETSIYMR